MERFEMIHDYVRRLTEYALATELIHEDDVIYTVNRIIEALGIDEYEGELPTRPDLCNC